MVGTGSYLDFLIKAPYSVFGDWSAFALYYSLEKLLPDANVFLKEDRRNCKFREVFNWVHKCDIKNIKNLPSQFIELDSQTLMIRPVEEDVQKKIGNQGIKEFCCDAKDDKFTPFVSFSNGCGNFVVAEWIDKDDYPFPHAERFLIDDMCINETEILKFWRRINYIYSYLTRGS
jgi:hypothetical protein